MRKAQELSLNLIVIGGLALLVLLIVGGVMIFGGGDLLSGLTSIGASDEEVALASFGSSCQSKCNVLNNLISGSDIPSNVGDWDEDVLIQVKNYCCTSNDLDSDGVLEYTSSGDYGFEYCAKFYDCMVDGKASTTFCNAYFTASLGNYDNEDILAHC